MAHDFARINHNFFTLTRSYFTYNHLPPAIQKWLDDQNKRVEEVNKKKQPGEPLEPKSTSCAIQVSHAFNTTPHRIKAGSFWRKSEVITGGNGIYILAVNELDAYLTATYGRTEDIRATQGNDAAKMQEYIRYFKGVLIFGGAHTEFWDGNHILQSGGGGAMMNPVYIWSRPFIKFWEISDGNDPKDNPDVVPKWAQGWWTVYDGNYYYYYFSGAGMVTYIKTKPNPAYTPPMTIGNQGKVTMTEHGLKIVWNPTGGGQTIETFTRQGWTSETEMNGESNRYSPLFARKLT